MSPENAWNVLGATANHGLSWHRCPERHRVSSYLQPVPHCLPPQVPAMVGFLQHSSSPGLPRLSLQIQEVAGARNPSSQPQCRMVNSQVSVELGGRAAPGGMYLWEGLGLAMCSGVISSELKLREALAHFCVPHCSTNPSHPVGTEASESR